ncbi:DedA family protein [Bosea sp. SSUT16]|jgi:membrane protein YqaA with SNARE-associated domain|uniref:DedA family protein n=1 Tax=Bosea spartocytisi TaxID=2773451 RepID=A0A927E9H9_9HYPH|nr:YqaA family protein [Bosea spartocytisi]MBD3845326.1 DedA family protein [Bosea spartocytisi]MCT4472497.1 DedA family protein [Bosea spartocytisi]
MEAFWSLAGMASAAFIAATLLPAQSEAVFIGLLAAKSVDPLALFLTASLANTAGSLLNWWLGRLIAQRGVEALPVRLRPDPARLAKAQGWFGRFGWPSLLFAWLPVVGDPLTFVAGTLNFPLGRFILLVLVGKAARYAMLWAGWTSLA